MTETLVALAAHLGVQGRPSRIVVWAHNSHLGDARATRWGSGANSTLDSSCGKNSRETRNIGFTTFAGSVTAATNWDEPAQHKRVNPGMAGSVEKLFHHTDIPLFFLDLTNRETASALYAPMLERAIGVIYRLRPNCIVTISRSRCGAVRRHCSLRPDKGRRAARRNCRVDTRGLAGDLPGRSIESGGKQTNESSRSDDGRSRLQHSGPDVAGRGKNDGRLRLRGNTRVNKERKPVGVIYRQGHRMSFGRQGLEPLELTVADVMSTPVVCVRPNDSLDECCTLMEEKQTRRVPVVDESGVCCGSSRWRHFYEVLKRQFRRDPT